VSVTFPAAGWRAEAALVVKRSRVLALAARVDDEAAARAVIAAERARYPDARHHCTAFIVEAGAGPPTERSSDDGEPAGTAGMPMLAQLRGAGLVDVVAVVTRYFGGVKLGTGGLTRAYGDAVAAALADVPRVTRLTLPVWAVEAGHAAAGRVTDELVRRGVSLLAQDYGPTRVRLEAVFPAGADAAALIAQAGQGLARGVRLGERTVEVAVAPGAAAE
jgi:uncharacterized YigZ family protein